MMRRLFMHGLNVFLCVCFSTPVYADPPSHAPAHGWHKKHDPYYVVITAEIGQETMAFQMADAIAKQYPP